MVGATKPDRLIFDDVVRRARGDRAGILYIDDREDLIKEASALGIPSIRFENADNLRIELRTRGII